MYDRLNCPKCHKGKIKLNGTVKILAATLDRGTCEECDRWFILSDDSSIFVSDDKKTLSTMVDNINGMRDKNK